MICSACQHEVSETARFCANCGARLTGAAQAGRRQITVLFCDIVGSVALSERLDLEDYRSLVSAYQECCSAIVQRLQGRIENLVGDGIVAAFGLPAAGEDDARRAVQSGLDIVAAVPGIGRRLANREDLRVRVGIHTGLAVVGEADPNSLRDQMGVIGSTPNIAARLQSLARPNTVVVSQDTLSLVQGLFVVEPLGRRKLRGLSRATDVFRVAEPSAARNIFEARAAGGLSPLIGRDREIEQLRQIWSRAREGRGAVVLLRGEAGIGKSRLLHECEQIAADAATRVTCLCDEYHRNTALYPAITELTRMFAIEPDDDRERASAKIRAQLDALGIEDPAVAEGLDVILVRPAGEEQAPNRLAPGASAQRKRQMLRALRVVTSSVAKRGPLLLIVEDAHWADPSTLELLIESASWIAAEPILIIVSTRPDPPFVIAGATEIALTRLERMDCLSLIQAVSERALRADPAVLDELVARSDGIPLFIEELTRSVESALAKPRAVPPTTAHAPGIVPATLQDSLMARLDRLGSARAVAQLAAVVGRSFRLELLAQIWDGRPSDLHFGIERLVEAGLIVRQPDDEREACQFSHELVRQTAYQSLLRDRRREIHRRIASALETAATRAAVAYPELLAHHYTEAALVEQALPLWRAAAKLAIQKSANLEAVAHLQRALQLLGTMPGTADTRALELELQLSLAGPLMAAKGYGAPELQRSIHRAMALCREAGSPPQIFPLMYGQWSYQQVTGQLRNSLVLAEEFAQLAEQQDDDAVRIVAYRLLGTSLQVTGQPVRAEFYLERACALFDPERHSSLLYVYGTDIGVMSLCALGFTQWVLGKPASARQNSRRAWERALATAHANTTGYCATFHTTIGLLCGELDRAEDAAAWTMRMASERNLPLWLASAKSLYGWAQLQRGRFDAAIAELRDSIAQMRTVNLLYWQPVVWIFLGEALSRRGNAEEAQRAFEQSRALMQKTGECWAEAELYRCWAGAWLRRGSEHARRARRLYETALKSAAGQGARAWELRIRIDLAEQAAAAGDPEEARNLLSPILANYPEADGNPDVAVASALIGKPESTDQPSPPQRRPPAGEDRATA